MSKKKIMLIIGIVAVVLFAALGFALFETGPKAPRPTQPTSVIDTSCPVQPCIEKKDNVVEPEPKVKKPKPKPEPKWDPFRKPWETG